MHADSYPVTFGYGATDGQYYGPHGSVGAYHKGEDRAMPAGTPIIVNGVQIGLSGNSGASSGPHLHIGRWLGGRDTNPGGGGFHFNDAVVTEINEDGLNGKYVRVQGDGASWVYLHMSQQTATVGQRLIAPAPAPAPSPPEKPYKIIETYAPAKEVVINKSTNKWGMNYDNFTAMNNNPIVGVSQGTHLLVSEKVHHNIGYDYYRQAGDVDGFNVLDCDDYVAPPLTPAPVPAPAPPPPPPAAPVKIPEAEKYTLVTDIVYFGSSKNAVIDQNALGIINAGTYFVYAKDQNMYNLTSDNQKNQNRWINPAMNKLPEIIPVTVKPAPQPDPEPTPEPTPPPAPVVDRSWQKMALFFTDGRAIPYKATNAQPFEIYDLASKRYVGLMNPHMPLHLIGTFQKDGGLYGITLAAYQSDVWPNIPMHFVKVDRLKILLDTVKKLDLGRRIDGIFKQ